MPQYEIHGDDLQYLDAGHMILKDNTVTLQTKLRGGLLSRLTAGILGGEGLFLARFTGFGNLSLHSYGGLIVRDLQPGETIQVEEASHLMAFEEGMPYSVQLVGGLRSIFFDHEGLFFVTITGPGRVWLHTLTAEQLASALIPYLPSGQQGGIQLPF